MSAEERARELNRRFDGIKSYDEWDWSEHWDYEQEADLVIKELLVQLKDNHDRAEEIITARGDQITRQQSELAEYSAENARLNDSWRKLMAVSEEISARSEKVSEENERLREALLKIGHATLEPAYVYEIAVRMSNTARKALEGGK